MVPAGFPLAPGALNVTLPLAGLRCPAEPEFALTSPRELW